MTAEIAVMNSMAVALAADSAVTVNTSDGPKIYNTANKLFGLSKYHPVGIMLFGQASMLGMPWETIIKEFRNELSDRKLETLEKYSDAFLYFLKSKNKFIPISQQEQYFETTVSMLFRMINKNIVETVKKEIQEQKGITDYKISKIASISINKTHSEFQKKEDLPDFQQEDISLLKKQYGEIIERAINHVFEKLPIFKKDRALLSDIAVLFFCKDIFLDNVSGIVISGFGKNDFFPKVNSFKIETILDGKLKFKRDGKSAINFKNRAGVRAFAQGEMVYNFMEGVNPIFEETNTEYLFNLFLKSPELIVDSLKVYVFKRFRTGRA